MSTMNLVSEKLGGWWTGITFHRDTPPDDCLAERPMRFCEAIAESRTGPLVLTPGLLDCAGGSRSLGWSSNVDVLARAMAEKAGTSIATARKTIKNTPCLPKGITAVTVGTRDTPDIVVSYAQPDAVMELLRHWQRTKGTALAAEVSSFMAVCGSVAARAYLTGRLCLSFGCPDSRQYGNIGRDRLVVGMPLRLVETLIEKKNRQAHLRV